MAALPSGTVTFLFTDIEGSTRLWEQDPEGMKASLATHRALVGGAIENAGGAVFKDSGDGLYAAFSSAAAAVIAASRAQGDLASAAWEGPALSVRMGVHTGEALPVGDDYHGPPLNRCARLMDAGHGGQTLVSGAAAELARGSLEAVTLVDLGEHRLRDLSQPERIFQAGEGEFPPLRTLDAIANNLPAQLSSFVGREREVAVVGDLLDEHRLVTLTGVGGTGKTRLALQTAADVLTRFPDGVFLVELASLSDPLLIEERIGACVQLPSPAGEMGAGRDDATRLIDSLRERRVLLVLDNCEHLIDATSAIVHRILTECERVCVLATSREALGIIGEQAWRVPSLGFPRGASAPEVEESEAGRLLLDRIALVEPTFRVTDANAGAVAEICRRLGGIPLALELAAARLATMAPDDVLARLDNQFRLLTGGSRTALERHQTLRAAIDWSFDLLSPQAQELLPMLSVFRGGWTLDGAEAVCAGDSLDVLGVADGLSELVSKSLVAKSGVDASRYSMVEPVRQYAAERLGAANAERTRSRHAEWMTTHVGVDNHLQPGQARESFERALFALTEYANFTEAVRWRIDSGNAPEALRLLGGGMFAILASGQYREGISLVEETFRLENGPCALRYVVEHFSSYLALWLDDPDDARRRLADARKTGEECPEVASLYWVDLAEATIALTNADEEEFASHRPRLLEAYDAAREEGGDYPRYFATFLLAAGRLYAGELDEAIELFEEAYAAMKDFPLAWVPYVLPNIAQAKVLLGRADADVAIAEAETVARASGDPAALAMVLHAHTMADDLPRARGAVHAVFELDRTVGLRALYSMPPAVEYAYRVGADRLAAQAYGSLVSRGAGPSTTFFDSMAAALRERLGDEVFEQETQRGEEAEPIELLAEIADLEPQVTGAGAGSDSEDA